MVGVELSCGLPPGPDFADLAVLAEELGYARVWIFDSAPLWEDPFVHLALAAGRTTRIGLATAVLIPSERSVMAMASCIATIARLSGDRFRACFGTGGTARWTLGQAPVASAVSAPARCGLCTRSSAPARRPPQRTHTRTPCAHSGSYRVDGRRRAAKRRQTKPNPQRDQQLIDRPKLRLEHPDDPSLTTNACQITSALKPGQRIKLCFQRLTNLDLPTIEQPPEVLGLIQVSIPP
jgi:Luciferase-like monooxygenase